VVNILKIRNLGLNFETIDGEARVLDNISVEIKKGQVVGLVGESGCGKSVTAKVILDALPIPPAKITRGEVFLYNQELLKLPNKGRKILLKEKIAYIPQDPTTSLNPVFTIGETLTDVIIHNWSRKKRKDCNIKNYEIELLDKVDIPDPKNVLGSYPFELSGGMKQRILIAMSLVVRPDLLIADEPTTALDVTVQKGIIQLILERIRKEKMSCLYITHNLGIAKELCNKIYVLYAGNVVEYAETSKLFAKPYHPYTKALFSAIPKLAGEKEMKGIEGSVPDYLDPPSGCRFYPRCKRKLKICSVKKPELIKVEDSHFVACHLFEKGR